MLIVKSKYKIAKRLGAGVFEQTQTQKFALSEARSRDSKKGGRRGGSEFGRQLLEKQRVRFTYGLSERQLSNYVADATHAKDPSVALYKMLEMRADTALYRAGFAPTRRAARQAVSHGHMTINGRRITTPSHKVGVGDALGIREGARKSPLYAGLADKPSEERRSVPNWLSADLTLLVAKVEKEPVYVPSESALDFRTVFEFYSR
ncbi:MAG TPA: 30S ribosomal protein S4 [Candidatus Paceibacterota bacterium]|nr:30S ribosomal protein S4 [Candidatus Paceibacterota bacterium]